MVRPIYYLNTGTIPDEVAVKVYTMEKKYVGKVEEPFAERLKKGDIFVLAGNTYEFVKSKGMRIYVIPRPEQSPTIPSWFSEQLPLSFDLAGEIGKFRAKMERMLKDEEKVKGFLMKEYGIDSTTAMAIINYFREQSYFVIPNNKRIVVEIFTMDGMNHIVFHILVGRKANEALSRIFAYRITSRYGFNVRLAITDNGFAIIYPAGKMVLEEKDILYLFSAENVREDLKRALENTEILKRRFRHVAARSFLILKNYLGHEMGVERQQRNASLLFRVVREIDPDFPALKETYREIMEDSMEIDNAQKILKDVESGKIKVEISSIEMPSPFSFNIVAIGASDVVLMEDRKKMIRELHKEVMEAMGWMK